MRFSFCSSGVRPMTSIHAIRRAGSAAGCLLFAALATWLVVELEYATRLCVTASAQDSMPSAELLPASSATPYGDDMDQRSLYEQGFRDGYAWAMHADRQMNCSSNPRERNGPAIHGWIEGWRLGVADCPQCESAGALPARYARFIAWDALATKRFPSDLEKQFPTRSDKQRN